MSISFSADQLRALHARSASPALKYYDRFNQGVLDHIHGVEPFEVGPFTECASKTACRRRWPKTTPEGN